MRIFLVVFSLLLLSCEDVIDLDLNEAEPKLVVEATMFRLLDNEGGGTEVTLSLTGPFFDNEVPAVTDALVTITDSNNNVFSFTHVENGRYVTNPDLIPQDDIDYTITIIYNNETYTATEQIESVVPWENDVAQDDEGGFFGDEIEVRAFFNDPGDEENFYFFRIESVRGKDIDTASDEFFNGNRIFALYTAENLQSGDEVVFQIDGVDRNYYDFQFILLQQGSEDGGGPFETQPATVRGNVVNVSNSDNFPLGYFRVSERDTLSYIVQ